jgi:DNA-binding Lrp family transcriptional regulator
MADIDDIDRTLLNRIQSDFPLVERPFAAIGQALGIPEADG